MNGWIYTLAGGVVSWASKKQTCISHSTMEAKFIALVAASKEAEWMRDLLLDIQLWPSPMLSIIMYCDSQATLSKAYNSVYNGKSRHIHLRQNYVRQVIKNGTISVVYVKSCRNLAYPLTKPLTRDLVCVTTRDIGNNKSLVNRSYNDASFLKFFSFITPSLQEGRTVSE
ncbi:hypothetical protein Tco_0891740 [Tanacetum coccineum]|uniref:Uncharacterized protein n=1 Tax=Tanacetum coccineum TaxID=301880 RepID=A0ABQ5C5B2_9ASTR